MYMCSSLSFLSPLSCFFGRRGGKRWHVEGRDRRVFFVIVSRLFLGLGDAFGFMAFKGDLSSC